LYPPELFEFLDLLVLPFVSHSPENFPVQRIQVGLDTRAHYNFLPTLPVSGPKHAPDFCTPPAASSPQLWRPLRPVSFDRVFAQLLLLSPPSDSRAFSGFPEGREFPHLSPAFCKFGCFFAFSKTFHFFPSDPPSALSPPQFFFCFFFLIHLLGRLFSSFFFMSLPPRWIPFLSLRALAKSVPPLMTLLFQTLFYKKTLIPCTGEPPFHPRAIFLIVLSSHSVAGSTPLPPDHGIP